MLALENPLQMRLEPHLGRTYQEISNGLSCCFCFLVKTIQLLELFFHLQKKLTTTLRTSQKVKYSTVLFTVNNSRKTSIKVGEVSNGDCQFVE
ncbi:hypothetical protein EGR_09716 [Echinococcus granulosus]|uniref:Uncharacterized protein n=1 Tax=Echinococcus granulosus TaxID=6210 RepID=W6UAH5_ECHGR|nr:hypothetical protein EGR_09716 [Echinococcus granulosus]EUB55437.1 hypothetical protein EGR_09716 [Echinococcus granulosus]